MKLFLIVSVMLTLAALKLVDPISASYLQANNQYLTSGGSYRSLGQGGDYLYRGPSLAGSIYQPYNRLAFETQRYESRPISGGNYGRTRIVGYPFGYSAQQAYAPLPVYQSAIYRPQQASVYGYQLPLVPVKRPRWRKRPSQIVYKSAKEEVENQETTEPVSLVNEPSEKVEGLVEKIADQVAQVEVEKSDEKLEEPIEVAE